MRKILLILSLILFSLGAAAQSVEQLRDQVKGYEAEIARINRLMESNKKKQSTAIQNQKLVNQKITNRKKIIKNLDTQITLVEEQLGEEGNKAIALADELNRIRRAQDELVRVAYIQYRNSNLTTLIGSNKTFLNSSRSVAGTSYVSKSLHARLHHIDTTRQSIQGQIESLTIEQQRLATLIKDKDSEIKKLEKEKRQLTQMTSQLANSNSQLSKKAAENRKKLADLQSQIANFVKKDSKAEEGKPIDYFLSAHFEQNIGKLPLPVKGGVIVDRFGQHDHPTQKGIKINNNGINLACGSGSEVKVVFDGEIRAVLPVSAMGNSVVVRHGKFLTVYSGLGLVSVKKGDKVVTGQKIGSIDSSMNYLHFELWNETTMLDPEKWLNI